jgi:uncharacterized RDD family membrane protein YckC
MAHAHPDAGPKAGRYVPHATVRMESLSGAPLASFGARAAAFLFDLVLVLAAFIPVMLLVEWLRSGRNPNAHIDVHFDFHDLSSLIFVVLYFGLTLYLGNGRTLGKRIMGIRVVSLTHTRISLWQSIERALGYGASFLEGGFGFVQYFIHPNRCCVHDRIAETIVVNDRK